MPHHTGTALSLSAETVTRQASHYERHATECHTTAAQCYHFDAPSCTGLRAHHALMELTGNLHKALTQLGQQNNTMADNLRTTAEAVMQADEDCAGGFTHEYR